jgi:cardiolipin synthase
VSNKTKPINGSNGNRWLTLPNLITTVRIVSSPGLVILAMMGRPMWLGIMTVALVFTEWLDGFLARRWHAESAIGARLDSVADAVFYASLLVALALLSPKLIGDEAGWIISAICSYAGSWLASWIKFRRLPSYHTWAAKGTWVVLGTGIVCLLVDWSAWPFRIAMICVVLANVEAILITLVLLKCEVDVPSLWHVLMRSPPKSRS